MKCPLVTSDTKVLKELLHSKKGKVERIKNIWVKQFNSLFIRVLVLRVGIQADILADGSHCTPPFTPSLLSGNRSLILNKNSF